MMVIIETGRRKWTMTVTNNDGDVINLVSSTGRAYTLVGAAMTSVASGRTWAVTGGLPKAKASVVDAIMDIVAAAAPAARHYVPGRVFIGPVASAAIAAGIVADRAAFDAAIVAAHRAGAVALNKVDMVGDFAEALIADSAVAVPGGVFHTIAAA